MHDDVWFGGNLLRKGLLVLFELFLVFALT